MLFDKLYETVLAGGWVLIPICAVGAGAFFIMFLTCNTIGADLFRTTMDKQLDWFKQSLASPRPLPRQFWLHAGISYLFLQRLLTLRGKSRSFVSTSFELEMARVFRHMERGLFFIGVLAAAAPLMGLYGTVNGMVATFETITMYGNSNPVLLADGISEALITTQSGLLIAFPLLLLKNLLDDRISFIQKQLHKLGLSAISLLEKQHE